jgi:hypothetical protein
MATDTLERIERSYRRWEIFTWAFRAFAVAYAVFVLVGLVLGAPAWDLLPADVVGSLFVLDVHGEGHAEQAPSPPDHENSA